MKKRKIHALLYLFPCFLLFACSGGKNGTENESKQKTALLESLPDWALGNFIRPEKVSYNFV